MEQPVACIPTLNTAISYLTDRSDIASFLIQYSLLNPGRISDFYNDLLISFRTIASEFGDNRDAICSELKNKFTTILSRYFPNDSITCEFTTAPYDENTPDDPRYRVKFDIYFTLEDGTIQPAVMSGHFNVDENFNITLNFA